MACFGCEGNGIRSEHLLRIVCRSRWATTVPPLAPPPPFPSGTGHCSVQAMSVKGEEAGVKQHSMSALLSKAQETDSPPLLPFNFPHRVRAINSCWHRLVPCLPCLCSSSSCIFLMRLSGGGGNLRGVRDRTKPGSQIHRHSSSSSITIASAT